MAIIFELSFITTIIGIVAMILFTALLGSSHHSAEKEITIGEYLPENVLVIDQGDYYTEYDGKKSFSIGGDSYSYGFVMGTNQEKSFVDYEINGEYARMTGTLGVLDGHNYEISYYILGDGEILDSIRIKEGGLPYTYDIDITGIQHISIIGSDGFEHGLVVGFTVPHFYNENDDIIQAIDTQDGENDQQAVYLGEDISAYAYSSPYKEYPGREESTFSLGGVAFNKGFTINTLRDERFANFNLKGKYRYLSGYVGNVDGVVCDEIFYVIGDGTLIGQIEIEGGTPAKDFTFDVKGVKELSIVSPEVDNYSKDFTVGFGNVAVYNDSDAYDMNKNYGILMNEE